MTSPTFNSHICDDSNINQHHIYHTALFLSFGLTSFGGIPIASRHIALRIENEAVKSDNVMSYLLSPLTKQCWPRYSRAPCFLGCRQAPQAQPRRRVGSVCMYVCILPRSPPRRNIINPERLSALPFCSSDSPPRSFGRPCDHHRHVLWRRFCL